ncbi:PREDICTED: O-acyltransferase WSD1-like [Nelumbo nucifera]|uniref:O-acyltransferase WSD1-like n=1 Tax=Nelumbo nucifera TaxID=4432 RepID=A0A1U8Q6H8_NELNU|nr:PREDICTED: O-acyltransferase WSD1-like [Nelumbo nucifera]XP_019053638.1 PREDICTED: O-acyltransferase WSD1-like [Nelumbo nucifera]XP_019053639.1 PREDICTED: O-acyltransferase WSD1-like [Nelumbo nucifera]XP_019053640.1 PREDICTED: O-acyltransferase WSD1-like [Nelumbo nucifera]XP_019053641.1 PREDICTED: O-acyltransferase WSD1-like [Nelumbo nucifera]
MEGKLTPTVAEEISDEAELASPHAQYLNSSALSLCILAALEIEVPIDDSQTVALIKEMFLPINPRFSSILVKDDQGIGQWRRVSVKPEDHVHVPVFPGGLSTAAYDGYFQDYMSKISTETLRPDRPPWEIHLFKYPTSSAAGTVVFKLHHALGDGFSLMGALFSCLQRADNPSLPLTFPASLSKPIQDDHGSCGILTRTLRYISMVFNSTSEFAWSLLRSNFWEDDKTPIRSGDAGIEFRPKIVSTLTLSIDQIRQIKDKIGATINDVLCGIIFYGTRLYMHTSSKKSSNLCSTALVLLNTRIIGNIQPIKEMMKQGTKAPWGNHFAFLHVPIPTLADSDTANPLDFVLKAKQIIRKKRSSLAVYLNGKLIDTMRQLRGPEKTAQYIHSTIRKTSMGISNMVGPKEKMCLAGYPIGGLYFLVTGAPQCVSVTAVSYMGNLRIAVAVEKGFIDNQLFKSCMEKAFERISEAALCT